MSSAWGKNRKEEVKKQQKRLTKFEREKIKAARQHTVLRCKREIVRHKCTDVIACRFSVVQLWSEHGYKVIRVKSKKRSKKKLKKKSKKKSKKKLKNERIKG